MIWVQQVDILYTKASRGAPLAARRNKLPRAFPMHPRSPDPYAFEHYKLLEWADFVPTLEERKSGAFYPPKQNSLVIEPSGDGIRFRLRRNRLHKPHRRDNPSALVLVKGRTARLILNSRSSYKSGPIYTEATYNVAFDGAIAPDVFVVAGEPLLLDLRVDLF
jgi:hypothetical protein